MRKKITFLSVLLVAALLLGMVPVGMFRVDAYAATADPAEDPAEGQSFDVQGSKTAAPTELDPENRETTVTLQLPAGEYKNEYDIVFVMDSSSSTVNSDIDFSEYALAMFNEVKDKNIDLNVGVIKCRGLAFDTISLVTDEKKSGMIRYSEENKKDIEDAIDFAEADLKKLSSGTNMHGGLVMADKWLSADKDVADDHKFVFFLLDGKTYIWNDEKDIPTSVYGQYMAKSVVYPKPVVGQQTIAYSKSAYKFTDNVNFFSATAEELANMSFDAYFAKTGNFYANDYAKLYASTNEELSKPTKYDYRCGYAYKESGTISGTVSEHTLTNANYTYNLHKKYYEFTPDAAFADLVWLQANPYTVANNDGVYSYTTTVNPDFYQLHPDQLQKALYLTGHLWTDMVEKYNGAVINYNGWGSGSGLEIAKSFNEWIKSKGISDYAADIADVNSVKAIFNSVKEDILYMISKGVVTDQITDEFTLKNADNANAFRMTLNGNALNVTFEDGKWNFGEAVDQVYPYVVEYDADSKTIKWQINVPVENMKPVTLSYDLIIDEDAENDTHDTNVSAILDYTSTDGKSDGSYTFEVPEVTYNAMSSYIVKYLEEGTNTPVHEQKDGGEKIIGSFVSEAAIQIKGYVLAEGQAESQSLKITKVAADNVITFLYKALKSSYKINHIDEDTDEILLTENGEEVQVGKYVSGSAIQFKGYELSPQQDEVKEIEITENADDNVIEFLYRAKRFTVYVEHWLEGWTSNDVSGRSNETTSSRSAVETAGLAVAFTTTDASDYGLYQTDTFEDQKFGTEFTAERLNPIPDGYHYDAEVTNELGATKGTVSEDGLVLKLYYSKNGDNGGGTPTGTTRYTVTYQYTGTVPAGAPSVPASRTYAVGASVPAAKVPSMDGYTFSGWSGEVSTMPNHDVTVTGSWSADEPIDDPDTPLAPPTDDETNIDDPDTPLAPGTIDEETEIDDEETPLSPFTGDNRHTGLWAGISIASLAGIALLSKRRRKPAKH
ncbi:MAG: hypothetical protein J6A42_09490 [Firmicutes bacterium]|nr:hypothetical protein [Bacillota bacterium]